MSRLLVAGVVLSALLLAGPVTADDAAQTYEKGLAAYNRGDLPGALPLFRQAAEGGSADAQAWLGYILDLAEEDTEAVRWYRAAHDRAARVLVHAYENGGLDVEPDAGKAAYWKSRKAELSGDNTQE